MLPNTKSLARKRERKRRTKAIMSERVRSRRAGIVSSARTACSSLRKRVTWLAKGVSRVNKAGKPFVSGTVKQVFYIWLVNRALAVFWDPVISGSVSTRSRYTPT